MPKKIHTVDQGKLFDVPESTPVPKLPKVETFKQFLTREAREGIKMMRQMSQEKKDREYIESLTKQERADKNFIEK